MNWLPLQLVAVVAIEIVVVAVVVAVVAVQLGARACLDAVQLGGQSLQPAHTACQ